MVLTWPWLFANPDRAIVGQSTGLECKTADSRLAPDWEDEPPLHYVVQCMVCMAVTGADRWHLCALVGGNRWFSYAIDRDDDTIAFIADATRRFWDVHVRGEVPPRVRQPASQAEERLLAVLYPKPDGNILQLTDAQRDPIIEHKQAVTLRGEIDKQVTNLAAQIKEVLGSKSCGFVGTDKAVSWTTRRDGVRVFRNHWKDKD
ncbi:MAG TPA: YqaJ viral recombinase family protein [Pseudonocardiaceae bacterium]